MRRNRVPAGVILRCGSKARAAARFTAKRDPFAVLGSEECATAAEISHMDASGTSQLDSLLWVVACTRTAADPAGVCRAERGSIGAARSAHVGYVANSRGTEVVVETCSRESSHRSQLRGDESRRPTLLGRNLGSFARSVISPGIGLGRCDGYARFRTISWHIPESRAFRSARLFGQHWWVLTFGMVQAEGVGCVASCTVGDQCNVGHLFVQVCGGLRFSG